MRLIGNIIWIFTGGIIIALTWFFAAIVLAVLIVGLPWARAAWEIGKMSLAPFGKDVITSSELSGRSSMHVGFLRLLANLVWMPFGFVLFVMHLVHGIVLCCTLIGIPFGLQSFKLAGISFFPVGKRVVTKEMAAIARHHNAQAKFDLIRTKSAPSRPAEIGLETSLPNQIERAPSNA